MADHRTEMPQAIQAVPSLGAIYIWASARPIEWWAAALGIVFLLLQIGHLLWRWWRDARIERDRRAGLRLQQEEVADDE